MTDYTMEDFYDSVVLFQKIAGKDASYPDMSLDFVDSVYSQLLRVEEELKETKDALHNEDSVEVLDGAIDLLFVVAGLLRILERSGYNTTEAMKRVGDNNLHKFFNEVFSAIRTKSFHCDNGQKSLVHKVDVDGETYYVVKRVEDSKVMKPKGFEGVDLTDLIPDEPVTEEEGIDN